MSDFIDKISIDDFEQLLITAQKFNSNIDIPYLMDEMKHNNPGLKILEV